MSEQSRAGTIGWIDLTVDNAESVRDFYKAVAGWEAEDVSMGDYSDYSMKPPGGEPVAGVCHARGGNANLPPVWMIYIVVADLDASVARVAEHGGAIVAGPMGAGGHRYAIIKDPAGAMCALYQQPGS